MTSRLKSKHGPMRQSKRECLRTFYVYAFTPPSRATSALSPAAPAVLFHNKIPFLFIIRKWSPTHIFPIKPLIYLLLAFNHYILCLETHRRRLLNYSRKSAKRLWQIRKFSLSGIERSHLGLAPAHHDRSFLPIFSFRFTSERFKFVFNFSISSRFFFNLFSLSSSSSSRKLL